MNFEDLQNDYRIFLDSFFLTHSSLTYLICNLKKFISDSYNKKSYSEVFTDELELNLAYLEEIYNFLDANLIFNNIEFSNFLTIKIPKGEIINIFKYMHVPDLYDIDIKADLSNPYEI